jgi:hypothetical protein
MTVTVRIHWPDLGRPTSPGIYLHQDRKVDVREPHIAYWRKHPDAALPATPTSTRDDGDLLVLAEPPRNPE